jgi:membrane-bound ClpP family serine protease
LLEELRAGYIQLGRMKGMSESSIVYRHALRNAFLPVLTVVGFRRIAELSGGSQETIDWQVNGPRHPKIKQGDQGVAFNNIRPNGTAIINDKRVEVYSIGEFIDRQTKVEVVKVEGYKIYVKPIKT